MERVGINQFVYVPCGLSTFLKAFSHDNVLRLEIRFNADNIARKGFLNILYVAQASASHRGVILNPYK